MKVVHLYTSKQNIHTQQTIKQKKTNLEYPGKLESLYYRRKCPPLTLRMTRLMVPIVVLVPFTYDTPFHPNKSPQGKHYYCYSRYMVERLKEAK